MQLTTSHSSCNCAIRLRNRPIHTRHYFLSTRRYPVVFRRSCLTITLMPPSFVGDYEIEQSSDFGSAARQHLASWSVQSCDDFGTIVYALADASLIRKTEQDSRADFDGVFNFDDAFHEGAKPRNAIPEPNGGFQRCLRSRPLPRLPAQDLAGKVSWCCRNGFFILAWTDRNLLRYSRSVRSIERLGRIDRSRDCVFCAGNLDVSRDHVCGKMIANGRLCAACFCIH